MTSKQTETERDEDEKGQSSGVNHLHDRPVDARTLSSEQDLLGVTRQTQPRRSLSVRQHLHPMNELLAPEQQQTQSSYKALQTLSD